MILVGQERSLAFGPLQECRVQQSTRQETEQTHGSIAISASLTQDNGPDARLVRLRIIRGRCDDIFSKSSPQRSGSSTGFESDS